MAYVALEWLPSCFDLFALGMFLAVVSSWLAHRRSTPRWLWNPALPWVSWALALGMLWAVSHLGVSRSPLEHNPPGRGLAQEVLYGLFAFFLLLPAVFGPQHTGTIRWVLRWKPVAALGVVSYGVYLWHQAWVDMYSSDGPMRCSESRCPSSSGPPSVWRWPRRHGATCSSSAPSSGSRTGWGGGALRAGPRPSRPSRWRRPRPAPTEAQAGGRSPSTMSGAGPERARRPQAASSSTAASRARATSKGVR